MLQKELKMPKKHKLEFYGNLRQDTTKPNSREIKGKGRKSKKNMYKSSFKMNPPEIYREGLSSIPSEQFAVDIDMVQDN